MSGLGFPRFVLRYARFAVCFALLLGCAQESSDTGAEIRVVNGDGAPVPRYLLFDWKDGEQTLVANRRVPDKGFLDPSADPLAVVRIASDATMAQRTINVRGMVEDQRVSGGTTSVRLIRGSWQVATVELFASMPPDPDAGAPPDDAGDDTGEPADADLDAGAMDVAAPPEAAPDPPDTGAPDLPADTQAPPLDLGRDLTPDNAPLAPVTIAPSADSYVEQGQTNSGMNFGKATILEVKSQGSADNNRVAYLRFPLNTVNGTVVTATLRLFGKSGGGANAESAYAVMDEAWTETGITWNNKPATGAKQFTVNVTPASVYREWNVTAFVKAQVAAGRPSVSLAVSMDMDTANSPDVHNSREAASNPPQLVITR